MTISAISDSINSTCGVGVYYNFVRTSPIYWQKLLSLKNEGGADWAIAGFIDTDVCRQAYKILTERFEIVYQSPVRINKNTGKEFFFCVYDTSKKVNIL